jgi:hypothetical protein
MDALLIVGCVLACVVLYSFVGWRFAAADMPNAWSRARKAWSTRDVIESSVRMQSIFMILIWPILVPVRVFAMTLNHTMRETDPKVLRERLKMQEAEARMREAEQKLEVIKRDQEIDRLERELNVGPYEEKEN